MSWTLRVDHPEFVPHPLFTNGHAMTIASAFWPRNFSQVLRSGQKRLFQVEKGVKLLTWCHWQPRAIERPTLVLVHGLEGSSESQCVLGVTEKAIARQMNVIRVNMRNCGNSMHLTPTLYDSGMSQDLISLVRQLKVVDRLPNIFLVGWSMGGNVVLKAAAEMAKSGPDLLSGVCVTSPSLDLVSCIKNIDQGLNKLYDQRFVSSLKDLIRKKSKLFPGMYDISRLDEIKTMSQFDAFYTAPCGGYGTAAEYYKNASALPIVPNICVPTQIVQAQDDPLIPFAPFESDNLKTPYISMLVTKHGGHVGFVNANDEKESDRFWAENRVVNFCQAVMKNIVSKKALSKKRA
jgi:predicted alpha/beta-fold hydrolase